MRALMRAIPDSFVNALAAVKPDPPIDVAVARQQHQLYRDALRAVGIEVQVLPALERCPDCCFIEDTAVVASGVVVITRPGAPSRRAETEAVTAALSGWALVSIESPATVDGGDCLRLGGTLYVGLSSRTNEAGVEQLRAAFAPRGLRVVAVELPAGVLHLKCVCSPIDEERYFLAEGTLRHTIFARAEPVWVPAEEAYAANAVVVGRHVLLAQGFPRVAEVATAAGLTVHPVPASEVRKADGSLTCQSILLEGG